jgi:uncharacterized protein (DUF433 family)
MLTDKIVAEGVWVNPERQQGRPCIWETRITTSAIKSLARAGYGVKGIQREYPGLDCMQIARALAWEARPYAERRQLSRCIPVAEWIDKPSVGH